MSGPGACLLCHCRTWCRVHMKGDHSYYQCRHCGLVAMAPAPTRRQMERGYRDDYLSPEPAAVNRWRRMTAPAVDAAARLITTRRGGRRGRLLDVGCGYGFFLAAMMSRGWRADGIELSETGRRYARRVCGAHVSGQPLEDLELPADRYDVVSLFYLVEHLPHPDRYLAMVRRILKPGGLLVLRWPHTTPIVRLLGPLATRLDLYHTPYHLYDFSPATMKRLLTAAGFGRIETVIGGHTLPGGVGSVVSVFFSTAGEWLHRLSGRRLLLPGVSKTTLAVKTSRRSNAG